MKKGLFTILLASASVITLASCNVIKDVSGKVTSFFSKPTEKTHSPKSDSADVSQEVVLPHDREHIAAKTEQKTYTSQEIGRGVVKGDWAIEMVNGKEAVGETVPFIKFVPAERKIYGNNGCNVINGDYTYNAADSTIRFTNIAATMRFCSKQGITDYEINLALDAARYYTWEIKGNDYYLYLLDDVHRPIMGLMHQNFEFLNGTWNVTAINDTRIDNPDMQLVIDVPEGKIHGNTGCNILNGVLDTDMDAANSISFSAIATTRMACPAPNYETELLVALEEAASAKPVSAKEVILLDSSGNQVLKLIRN